jgi:hypothetical protein
VDDEWWLKLAGELRGVSRPALVIELIPGEDVIADRVAVGDEFYITNMPEAGRLRVIARTATRIEAVPAGDMPGTG